MTDIFELTNSLVNQFVNSNGFKLSELENAIEKANAPMRVAPTYTVRNCIEDLVDEGYIRFNYQTNRFSKTDNHKITTPDLFKFPPIQ